VTCRGGLAVACAQQDFDEMAGNLLETAFGWARKEVKVRVHRDDGRSVVIAIEDDGPGLRPDEFHRFYA
jgi:signal transduction histidine kinase